MAVRKPKAFRPRMPKTVIKDITTLTWVADAKKKALQGCVDNYSAYPDACTEEEKIAIYGQELMLGLGIAGTCYEFMHGVNVSSGESMG